MLNLEILTGYTTDDYKKLCGVADFYGMDALTEEQQYVVEHWHEYQRWIICMIVKGV